MASKAKVATTPSKAKKAAASDASRRSAKMAYGACCIPNCLCEEKANAARASGNAYVRTETEFCQMVCTYDQCTMGGQCHRECLDRLEEGLMRAWVTSRKKHQSVTFASSVEGLWQHEEIYTNCLLYTSPSPRD